MNLFRFELRRNVKSLIIWGLCAVFMIAAGMNKYAASVQSGISMNQFIRKMPRIIQSLFGAGDFDLSKALGFYSVMLLFLILIAVIHATLLGSTILSKEERDKTSEFLYTKPISRWQIVTQKIAACLVMILALNVILLISSIVFVHYFSKGEADLVVILNMMGGTFLLQLIFFMIGLFCSAISKSPRTSPALASGLLLFFFLLYKLIEMDKRLDWLQVLTPFAYFTASNMTSPKGVPLIFFILSGIMVISLMIFSYSLYKKRNISF